MGLAVWDFRLGFLNCVSMFLFLFHVASQDSQHPRHQSTTLILPLIFLDRQSLSPSCLVASTHRPLLSLESGYLSLPPSLLDYDEAYF